MVTDWKTYSMRRDMMPPGWKDKYGTRRYFEIVLVNKSGQEIGRGYNIEQCLADKEQRRARSIEQTSVHGVYSP